MFHYRASAPECLTGAVPAGDSRGRLEEVIMKPTMSVSALAAAVCAPLALSACPVVEDVDDGHNDGEVITKVALTFAPAGGGAALTAAFSDPENDGDPTIDSIALTNGTTYTLTLAFENQLAEPAEDITAEVEEEGGEHQVFVYGSAVQGPATGTNASHRVTHAYADVDDAGGAAKTEEDGVGAAGDSDAIKVVVVGRHLGLEKIAG
jgi:hypothetical protein